MIHEILPVGPLQCNCSIIGDEQSREAMVIDPGDEIEQVLAILQRHGLTVKQIVITHAHIDHIGGAAKLKRITGAPVLLNANDQALLKMLDVQAIWLGMRPPETTAFDASLTTGDRLLSPT
jgi:glyoxylase-like metal-dependent hydrolase (beta-lactamase superfamily II)